MARRRGVCTWTYAKARGKNGRASGWWYAYMQNAFGRAFGGVSSGLRARSSFHRFLEPTGVSPCVSPESLVFSRTPLSAFAIQRIRRDSHALRPIPSRSMREKHALASPLPPARRRRIMNNNRDVTSRDGKRHATGDAPRAAPIVLLRETPIGAVFVAISFRFRAAQRSLRHLPSVSPSRPPAFIAFFFNMPPRRRHPPR